MYSGSVGFRKGARFWRSVAREEDVLGMGETGTRVSDVDMLASRPRWVGVERKVLKAAWSSDEAGCGWGG